MKSENKFTRDSFIKYCKKHPELRFWQALLLWSDFTYITVYDYERKDIQDTFYFKGRVK